MNAKAPRVGDLTDEEAREIRLARLQSRMERFPGRVYHDDVPADPLTPELARWHAKQFIASNGPHNLVRQLAEAFLRLQDADE